MQSKGRQLAKQTTNKQSRSQKKQQHTCCRRRFCLCRCFWSRKKWEIRMAMQKWQQDSELWFSSETEEPRTRSRCCRRVSSNRPSSMTAARLNEFHPLNHSEMPDNNRRQSPFTYNYLALSPSHRFHFSHSQNSLDRTLMIPKLKTFKLFIDVNQWLGLWHSCFKNTF